ncbi:MAG: glycosyltransferase family 4 protein [Planctomycetes bacterium]|uniref:glycosyltransferase family 4 protein n=1 Tax=Candidatus Wunengus sp. YC65 TaxID=3367701 RepID=UPI001D2D9C83|nr:glycosyltransferase family 4 protein [Planctomycetota bacterium]
MRIFYICYENLSLQRAATTHIKEVTEHLVKFGNSVILFAPNIGRLKKETTVPVVYVPTLKISFFTEYIYYVCLLFYLFTYQIRLKADVFYIREMGLSIVPAFVGFVLRVPHILEINGLVSIDFKGMGSHRVKHKIFEFFQYINFILADKVVSVSENIKSELQRIHKNTHKIVVIENGVNTDLFYPKDKKETRRSLMLNQNCYYLLFVGSFYPHHGVHHIIHILNHITQKLPNVRLIMIGSGYLRESTIRLTKKLGLISPVNFIGEVDYKKIPSYINAADAGIYIITGSGTIYGKSGLKFYEYMACGRPVITGESCGDFVRENDIGIVIQEEDYEQAANAIVNLLQDNERMNTMGKNGRKLVMNSFTWEITTKKILDVCRTI